MEESIYFSAFGCVFLEIQYFGILTSYFQIFESEALETGVFAHHPWKPMGNNGNIFFSDYRCLVLDIFEKLNLLTLVSIRRNLGNYCFLREHSHLMLKNNIRTGLVRFRSILVEISYLGRALSFHVVIFESALKNANPPQPLGVRHEKPIFKKLPKLNENFIVD
jgi:hypothetical protein